MHLLIQKRKNLVSIELIPWFLRLDSSSQHLSGKIGNRQTNQPTTVILLVINACLFRWIFLWYLPYCRQLNSSTKGGQRSPFPCQHPVTWHDTDSASYVAMLIGEVNDAITFEQTAFRKIHKSKT